MNSEILIQTINLQRLQAAAGDQQTSVITEREENYDCIKGIGILLHWLLKLALLPVIIVLILITGMFDFAGGVIQMICGLFGAILL